MLPEPPPLRSFGSSLGGVSSTRGAGAKGTCVLWLHPVDNVAANATITVRMTTFLVRIGVLFWARSSRRRYAGCVKTICGEAKRSTDPAGSGECDSRHENRNQSMAIFHTSFLNCKKKTSRNEWERTF
jgi:hypothetical protein